MRREEAHNIVLYYECRKKRILSKLQELQSSNMNCFTTGAAVLLHNLLNESDMLHKPASETVRIMSREETSSEDEEIYSSDSCDES